MDWQDVATILQAILGVNILDKALSSSEMVRAELIENTEEGEGFIIQINDTAVLVMRKVIENLGSHKETRFLIIAETAIARCQCQVENGKKAQAIKVYVRCMKDLGSA